MAINPLYILAEDKELGDLELMDIDTLNWIKKHQIIY